MEEKQTKALHLTDEELSVVYNALVWFRLNEKQDERWDLSTDIMLAIKPLLPAGGLPTPVPRSYQQELSTLLRRWQARGGSQLEAASLLLVAGVLGLRAGAPGEVCPPALLEQVRQAWAMGTPMDRARFEKAPCYLCGYNGPEYFQPEQHLCAERYHRLGLG